MAGGRPKGAKDKTKRTTAARKMAAVIGADGISPADVMVRVTRHHWNLAVNEDGEIVDVEEAQKAFDAAEKAAPYFNARLASTTVKGDGKGGGFVIVLGRHAGAQG